jgi:mannonate dehydratase
MKLKKTWRWFGDSDPVELAWLKQIGVEGVVTALHHIPNGEAWTVEEIRKTQKKIEDAGLAWEVVESLPVSEEIKLGSALREKHVENYKTSLENLGKCGIHTVVYNFMPVIDWIRTDLNFTLPGGGESMLFDYATFAAFDIYILKRPGAASSYHQDILGKAEQVFNKMTVGEAEKLAHNIIVVTQGFIDGLIDPTVEDYKKAFLNHLEKYKQTGKNELRENLAYFLNHVIPTAERSGINLAIHPDDPPFPVLGLPRIFSTIDDMEWLKNTNPSLNNGIAFCVGSFSARADNNPVEMFKQFSSRVHFVHLRNTEVKGGGSFYESGHLMGRVNMAEMVKALIAEMEFRENQGRQDAQIPMRPDHGIKFFNDFGLNANPGYPLTGRLKGLAEIAGLEEGVVGSMNW